MGSPGQRMPVAVYRWGPAQAPSALPCPAQGRKVLPFMPSRLHPVLHLSMSWGDGGVPLLPKGRGSVKPSPVPNIKVHCSFFLMDARSMIPAGSQACHWLMPILRQHNNVTQYLWQSWHPLLLPRDWLWCLSVSLSLGERPEFKL